MRKVLPFVLLGGATALAAGALSNTSSKKKVEEDKGKSFSSTPVRSHKKNKAKKADTENAKLLYFSAKWCMVCRRVKPAISDIQKRYPHIKIVHIDIDEKPEVADKYHIAGVPSFVGLIDNKIVAKKEGYKNKEDLTKKVVDPLLAYSNALPPADEPLALPGDEQHGK